jgi:hypothetical protein
VNAPFWSDHKQKSRWLHLPAGAHIGFHAEREWDFPAGTVAVKHFDLAVDERDPSRKRRLETRVLVVDAAGGAYGRTYKWRPDGSDADLLPAPTSEILTMVSRTPVGPLQTAGAGTVETSADGVRLQSPGGTLFAHTAAPADFDLGVKITDLSGGRAGLMLRQRPDGGAWLWLSSTTVDGKRRVRLEPAGATTQPVPAGAWLRLRRTNGVIRAYTSDDGQLWRALPGTSSLDGKYLGLALEGAATARVTPVHLLARDHYYPSNDECMACHTRSAHLVLGASTRQWNRDLGGENQLVAASRAGLFDRTITAQQPAAWRRLVATDDEAASLEDRVRSYLDANCAQCHRPGVLAQIRMDLRYDTPLPQQGIVNGLVRWPNAPLLNELIVIPKDLDRSRLYQRVRTHRMPPLGSLLNNDAAIALLERWIMSLDGPPTLRAVDIDAQPGKGDTFRVQLTSPDPSVEIHYTTDGSGPSRETPRYTAPFEVPRLTVVRAIAYKPGFTTSKLASRDLAR